MLITSHLPGPTLPLGAKISVKGFVLEIAIAEAKKVLEKK